MRLLVRERWRWLWRKLLAYVVAFGFAVPLICVTALSVTETGVADTLSNGWLLLYLILFLSFVFVPFALLNLLLCYLAIRPRPSVYKRICVLLGILWGAVICSFFAPVQTVAEAAIVAGISLLAGGFAGLFVSRFWKPRAESGHSDL